MTKQSDQSYSNEQVEHKQAKVQHNQDDQSEDSQDDDEDKPTKKKIIKKKTQKKKPLRDMQGLQDQDDFPDDPQGQLDTPEKILEGQMHMLPEQRSLDKTHPKYHFTRFISRHYRLIQSKKDRKKFFVRMQPVFVRFLHILKVNNLPLVTIDTFRKYFKKFFKVRGIKYQQTTNNVDMRVVIGIDRRYNTKFDF